MTTLNHVGRRIGALRKLQELTLKVLADRCGVTKGYLSKIEHAKVPPPFSTLEKIASAMDVDINDLLASGQTARGSRNIDYFPPQAKRRRPFRADGVCAFRPLMKSYRNKQMSPFYMSIQPGRTQAFKHDAEEFVYIISGNIEMRYDGASYHFKTGDSFYLDSRIGHTFINHSGAEVRLLVVDYNYRRF